MRKEGHLYTDNHRQNLLIHVDRKQLYINMGANESTETQTQGTVDGRPATFFYQRASTEGAGQEGWLKWTEGYQIRKLAA